MSETAAVFTRATPTDPARADVVELEGDALAELAAMRAELQGYVDAGTALEASKKTRRQRFVAGVAALTADDVALNPPTGTPTNAQVLTATRHCVKALLFLADVLKDARLAGNDE